MRGDVECMSRGEICVTIFLVINTWTDIRKREICLPVLGLFFAGGILWRIIEGTLYPQGLSAMGIGGATTIISVMSRGGVGAGDSLLILAMGTVLNAGTLMGILCMAMLLCGIYAGLQLCVFKKARNEEIPFAPFLLAGYMGGIFL